MKAIIVDDSLSIRETLSAFMETELGISILATFNTGLDFLKYPNTHEADVILMDINMPGLDGIETSKYYLWEHPEQLIVAVTMHTDCNYLEQLIAAGIRGYVNKNHIFRDLKEAIYNVMNNKVFFPEEIRRI